MAVANVNSVLGFLRELAETQDTRKVPDRELLTRFNSQGDEAAFKALVRRHGPMVFRLCLRLLRSQQDAEDAFQATFLVLAKKAGALRQPDSIGSWLFGVASRLACNMRKSAARRHSRESQAPLKPSGDPFTEISVREAQEMVDEELSRLPEKYQAPFVLCCLEGMTRDEAARQLGLPLSTLRSRLEHSREVLRARLAQRGLTVTGALLASLLCGLAPDSSSAAMPATLAVATARAAAQIAAGKSAAASVVSAKVAALTEGMVKAMFMTKLSVATVLVSGILFVAAAGTLGIHAAATDQPAATAAKGQEVSKAAPPETKREPADEKRHRTEEDLKKLLTDKDEEVRKAAIEALKKFDKDGSLAALKADDAKARQAAVEALGKIDKDAKVHLIPMKNPKILRVETLGKIQNVVLIAVDAKQNTISVRIAGVAGKRVWTDLTEVKDKGLTPGGLYLAVDGKLVHLPIDSARLEGLPLAKNAKITIDGKQAAISDLKVPILITLSLVTDGEKLEVREIHAGK